MGADRGGGVTFGWIMGQLLGEFGGGSEGGNFWMDHGDNFWMDRGTVFWGDHL